MKNIVCLFFFIVWFSGMKAQTFHEDYLDGVLYVKIHDTSSVELDPYTDSIPDLDTLVNQYAVSKITKAFQTQDSVLQKIYRLEFDDIGNTGFLIDSLQQLSFIEYAEKMPLFKTNYMPDDEQSEQWYFDLINAHEAWDISKGSTGVTIAVVDNAVSTTHEDLTGNIWNNPNESNNGFDDDLNGYTDDINGYDVADGDNNPNPPSGTTNSSKFTHGTLVAGIASASTDNSKGVASMGFNSKIVAVKCSPNTSDGEVLTHAYEGIDYAISAGVDIINMSFGSSGQGLTGEVILQRAYNDGILLVAAGGNNNSSNNYYPASYAVTMAVGATNSNDEKASFSNYGSYIDVMAPGTNIYTTFPENDNTYGAAYGTSVAAPIVSGIAALVITEFPNLSPSEVEEQIENGCKNVDGINPGYSGQLGAGRVNAEIALDPGAVKVASLADQNVLSVYPNPVKEKLYVQWMQEETVKVAIKNMTGEVVHTATVPAHSASAFTLPLPAELTPGIYLLQISGTQQTKTMKFIYSR